MSFSDEASSNVPLLPASHSGLPSYLLEEAERVKAVIFETRDKPTGVRQRLPVIPQGIEPERFFEALADLRGELGDEHVEVNDKPLKDGWFVILIPGFHERKA